MANADSISQCDKFVAIAAELVPSLAARAPQCEAARRIPDETITDLREAGLLQLLTPTELGGQGCDVRTMVHVTAELAKGCASTAWVTTLLNPGPMLTAQLLPPEGASEVLGSVDVLLCCGVLSLSGTATVVDGGYVVDGSWGFASGCLNANWALMGVRIIDASGAETGAGLAWMPITDLTIKDTWYVAGMRGTGSNTLVVDHVFVPHHRVALSPDEVCSAFQHSLAVPVCSVILVAALLGAAESILQGVLASLGRGITYFDFERKTDSHVVLNTIGEAAMLIDSAWMHIDRALGTVDAEAIAGPMDYRTSARGQADTVAAVEALRRAAALLMNVAGASGFAEASPLQRAWRDLEVGSHHAMLNVGMSYELYGRVLAEVTPNTRLWGPDARFLV